LSPYFMGGQLKIKAQKKGTIADSLLNYSIVVFTINLLFTTVEVCYFFL